MKKNNHNAFAGVNINSLYNNYAARYCYNKNKRDANGNIIEYKWYLPAINELKPLTIDNNLGMQNDGYWSSSIPTYAEATEKPKWWDEYIWDPLGWIWSGWQAIINFLGGGYNYSDLSKAAIKGEEQLDPTSTPNVVWYPKRTSVKKVRAVRLVN